MKINILFTLGILFFPSCDGGSTNTNFYVKNSTNHKVQLTVFNTTFLRVGVGMSKDIYELPTLSEIRYVDPEEVMNNNAPSRYPFSSLSDSVFVTFDDTLRVTFRRNDANPRNILDITSYSEDIRSKHLYQYYYSIADQDYAEAKKIN